MSDTAEAPAVDGEATEIHDEAPARPTPVRPVDESGTALVRREGPTPALFREDEHNPGAVVALAVSYANTLKGVLTQQQMISRISGKDHVNIEGWQTLGTMTRVAVKVIETAPICNPVTGEPLVTEYPVHVKDFEWVTPEGGGKKVKRLKAERDYIVKGWDWKASAEARLPDGTLVGSSDAVVRRTEDRWAKADDTAVLGMAQTRAMSRAYRAALGWVVHLAGYAVTPSEEMPPDDPDVEASADLKRMVKNVCSYLVDDNPEAVKATLAALAKQFDGALPANAGQAIVLLGGNVKAHRDAQQSDRAAA